MVPAWQMEMLGILIASGIGIYAVIIGVSWWLSEWHKAQEALMWAEAFKPEEKEDEAA
jgi:hypothetical protein